MYDKLPQQHGVHCVQRMPALEQPLSPTTPAHACLPLITHSSQGLAGYISSFQDHADNFQAFLTQLHVLGSNGFPPGVPIFLAGFSMGGLVAVMTSLSKVMMWWAGRR